MKELVESHTTEIAALSEKFRGEVESMLSEQKKDIKVKIDSHFLLTLVLPKLWIDGWIRVYFSHTKQIYACFK